ncbi:hypothetical protein [Rhizobium lentis]|uniref:SAM-dependent methyltransferase n=1 Tax=Rhizobium lentis TaxID=1138194 RepID=A0A7W8XCZ1_9HYPH|nr:hypothetical protein [Rhizobium lentis]MBB4574415.1 hypothetical protein [Rhizobium lentis]MBB5550341.1 hypothetical protein [Rhizobium lentis]MBB5560630.1 hypothetical protein [Rhizobium lentis]MBB5567215.1 hypothetical protein [Rhizobium lentis]
MSDDLPITISVSGGPSIETTLGGLKAAAAAPGKGLLPAARADASDLAATIERARKLFDEQDYQAALLLSSGAYDQAKAAASYGKRMKASEQLIGKARQMQGDALLIESRAKMALADQYDDAQKAGVLATQGRPKNIPDENVFTLKDAGLSSKEIHEARKLRDAEAKQPGLVERAIEARLAQGFEPSRANLRAAVGTASASKEDRGDNFYQTPVEATRTLLAYESFSGTVWESSCGLGAISRVLEAAGYEVIISDLVDRGTVTRHGELQTVGDFLATAPDEEGEGPDIVSNPPYGEVLNDYVAHALRVHKPRKMALLLNLNFLCGFADEARNFVMDENPPARVYVFKRRLPMMHREGYEGPKASSRMNTAWFVWERQEDGSYGDTTVIKRVDWKDFEEAQALQPGAGGNIGNINFDEFRRDTPRKTLDERVEDISAKALIWCAGKDDFDAVELRRAVGVRPSTAEGAIHWMLEKKLINPAGEGRFKTASGGWTALKATAAVINDRKLFELIEQVQGVAA